MNLKHYALSIGLLLAVTLAVLYLRSKVAAVSPPPSESIDDDIPATATIAAVTDIQEDRHPVHQYEEEDKYAATAATPETPPPPDPRKAAWDSYCIFVRREIPPSVKEDYYQYMLERYAGLDIASVSVREEFSRLLYRASYGNPPLTREESERYRLLRDYGEAVQWQSLREKYADWDYARAKEELGRNMDIDEEWRRLPDAERVRWMELFWEDAGLFRREYLFDKYAGWDVARAEEELDRFWKAPLMHSEEAPIKRSELAHYIGILRYEAQGAPVGVQFESDSAGNIRARNVYRDDSDSAPTAEGAAGQEAGEPPEPVSGATP